jgi:hypothetical protein
MLKLATISFVSFSMLFAAEVKLGKPLTLKQATPIAALASEPEKYVGKTVQAKGKVSEVCQKMGCWMNLVDDNGKSVRIKVKDGGDIKFPKDAPGKMATAEGTFAKLQLTKQQAVAQAKHEAEVSGKKFDPASVTGPVTINQINGQGAVIGQ